MTFSLVIKFIPLLLLSLCAVAQDFDDNSESLRGYRSRLHRTKGVQATEAGRRGRDEAPEEYEDEVYEEEQSSPGIIEDIISRIIAPSDDDIARFNAAHAAPTGDAAGAEAEELVPLATSGSNSVASNAQPAAPVASSAASGPAPPAPVATPAPFAFPTFAPLVFPTHPPAVAPPAAAPGVPGAATAAPLAPFTFPTLAPLPTFAPIATFPPAPGLEGNGTLGTVAPLTFAPLGAPVTPPPSVFATTGLPGSPTEDPFAAFSLSTLFPIGATIPPVTIPGFPAPDFSYGYRRIEGQTYDGVAVGQPGNLLYIFCPNCFKKK